MTTVYISIGNSDDKLTQAEWARYWDAVNECIATNSQAIHGEWLSLPSSSFQNACWAVAPMPNFIIEFKAELSALAAEYRQDSIAWAECPETEFLKP